MNMLIASDLHFTDNPRDAYRLRLFEWLASEAVRRHANYIIILGDLTESKDRHSASLVNAIADGIRILDNAVPTIVLMGNHDYVDPTTPYFRWLRHTSVEFYVEPTIRTLADKKCLFLPHTRAVRAYAEGYDLMDFDYIFAHQTFRGASIGGGKRLEGLPTTTLANTRAQVYCGDVHVPQRLANIEYVGAPYHVDFGDEYIPRVIFDDGQRFEDVSPPFPAKRKMIIDGVDHLTDMRVNPGDMIKIEVRLKRQEFDTWNECRRRVQEFAERQRAVLCGCRLVERDVHRLPQLDLAARRLPPGDLFNHFCASNGEQINEEMKAAGLECLVARRDDIRNTTDSAAQPPRRELQRRRLGTVSG